MGGLPPSRRGDQEAGMDLLPTDSCAGWGWKQACSDMGQGQEKMPWQQSQFFISLQKEGARMLPSCSPRERPGPPWYLSGTD